MSLFIARRAGLQRRRARSIKFERADETSRGDPAPLPDNADPCTGRDQTPPHHRRWTAGGSSGTHRIETPGAAHVGRLRSREAAPDGSRR